MRLAILLSCGHRMNDPNGPMYDPVHDMYHLFYQYQTPRMWGHAASRDLIDWWQLPMALTRQRSYDEGGDFSGSATVLDDANRTPVPLKYSLLFCILCFVVFFVLV
jgi:sucrose-6-phosphate hydrolase SacC (GH32 family)